MTTEPPGLKVYYSGTYYQMCCRFDLLNEADFQSIERVLIDLGAGYEHGEEGIWYTYDFHLNGVCYSIGASLDTTVFDLEEDGGRVVITTNPDLVMSGHKKFGAVDGSWYEGIDPDTQWWLFAAPLKHILPALASKDPYDGTE